MWLQKLASVKGVLFGSDNQQPGHWDQGTPTDKPKTYCCLYIAFPWPKIDYYDSLQPLAQNDG